MIDKIKNHQKFQPEPRLHIKYQLYLLTSIVSIAIVLLGFFSFLNFVGEEDDLVINLGVAAMYIIAGGLLIILLIAPLIRIYYKSIAYEIVEDEVHVFRGIITQTRKIVPYRTITNLDVKFGPFDRLLNLGTIEIQTAGNSATKTGPEERIDGLPGTLVSDIQENLISRVRRMRGSAGVTHDFPDEEQLLSDILHEVKELRKTLQSN